MMKSSKSSKIKSYSAVASSLLMSGFASAQNIQYTDVNPDVILDKTSGPFELDMNNDTGIDMTFEVASFNGNGSSTYMGIPFTFVYNGSQANALPGPSGGVQGQVVGSSSTFGITALNGGDAINSANNFSSQSAALGVKGTVSVPAFNINYNINQGEFLGVSQKFMGMKFSAGASIHYGWVRLSLDTLDPSGLKLIIHDYAYNANPDEQILAGEGSVSGINQVAIENKVTIKPMLDQININVTPDLIGGMVKLISMDGREVYAVKITDVNTEIILNDRTTGIYQVQMVFDQGQVSKKIYVR